jgi:hypothetical protein
MEERQPSKQGPGSAFPITSEYIRFQGMVKGFLTS